MSRIGATVSATPAPKPAAVNPPHRPRLSGNHLRALPTEVPMPPARIIHFGPIRSTMAPSIGTNQVSHRMKMVKATWISALDQPNCVVIGPTNNVQAYCKFATDDMQMIPKISWVHRRAVNDPCAADEACDIRSSSPVIASFLGPPRRTAVAYLSTI